MPTNQITRADFLADRQGRTFADVVQEFQGPLDEIFRFFSDADRQRRMEESELHHDRAPLAGVVRELEALPTLHELFATADATRSKRVRQAVGVIVRIIMERRGWDKTGRKGSLGVRAAEAAETPKHNTGGLALWFLRAERYQLPAGMPFNSVRRRRLQLESHVAAKTHRKNGRRKA